MKNIYKDCRSFLYSKKGYKIVHFLAHGAFHIVIAIFLLIICILLYKRSTREAGTIFKSIEVTCNDTHSNDLERFHIEFGGGGKMKQCTGYNSRFFILMKYTDPPLPVDTFFHNSEIFYYEVENNVGERLKIFPERCSFPFHTKLERISTTKFHAPGSCIYPCDDRYNRECVIYDTEYNKISHCDSISLEHGYIQINTYTELFHTSFRRPPIMNCVMGDFLGILEDDNNPYFCFSLKLYCGRTDSLKSGAALISITLDVPDSLGILHNPIQITNIFPQPTYWSVNEIEYRGKEKIAEVLENQGLIFYGINYAKKANSERKVFLYTILLGAVLAFLFDVIVNLIIKWKKLSEKENHFLSKDSDSLKIESDKN